MSRYSKTKEKYLLTFYGIHDELSPDVVFNITNQWTTNYTSPPTITITPIPRIILKPGRITILVIKNNPGNWWK